MPVFWFFYVYSLHYFYSPGYITEIGIFICKTIGFRLGYRDGEKRGQKGDLDPRDRSGREQGFPGNVQLMPRQQGTTGCAKESEAEDGSRDPDKGAGIAKMGAQSWMRMFVECPSPKPIAQNLSFRFHPDRDQYESSIIPFWKTPLGRSGAAD
jgi:hypothetical protein